MASRVDLGFVEELTDEEKFKLKSKYFPSKVGGKPSWLSFRGLPSFERLKCDLCGNPLIFLLQIYAPFEDSESTFHRTLFLFCCVLSKCSNGFKVFRSQLKRSNEFFNFDPPDYEKDDENYDPKPEDFGCRLCAVCGCFGDKFCSSCRAVSYCSKEHQAFDWKLNGHRTKCGNPGETRGETSSLLFPEFELIMEEEEEEEETSDDECNNKKSDEQRINECLKYIKDHKPSCQNENLDEYEKQTMEDEVFDNFKKVVKRNSDQVIRYYSYDRRNENMEPLFVSDAKPSSIPNCENCGVERKLEFQVMPQILNHISDATSTLDFGSLFVYTCRDSCLRNDCSYVEEFIYKQNFSTD